MSRPERSAEPAFEPPGTGPWELETTHFSRPVTAFVQAAFAQGFVRGFQEGTARYGLLLDHLEPGFSQSFLYTQPGRRPGPWGRRPSRCSCC